MENQVLVAIGLLEEAAVRHRYGDDWEQDLQRLERESASNEFKLRIVAALAGIAQQVVAPFRKMGRRSAASVPAAR